MRTLKLFCLALMSSSFGGCFVTSNVITDFGVKRGTIDRATRISGNGNDYLIEFHARHYLYQSRDLFFWKRIDKDLLFAVPEHAVSSWKLSTGHIPEDIGAHIPAMPGCFSSKNSRDMIEMRDDCAQKNTQLKIRGQYVYKSRWRPVLLPILVPAACVADVLIAPALVAYFAKCYAFGCRK